MVLPTTCCLGFLAVFSGHPIAASNPKGWQTVAGGRVRETSGTPGHRKHPVGVPERSLAAAPAEFPAPFQGAGGICGITGGLADSPPAAVYQPFGLRVTSLGSLLGFGISLKLVAFSFIHRKQRGTFSGIITACENGGYKTKSKKSAASRNDAATVFCETKPNDGHGQNRKPPFFHGKMDGLVRAGLEMKPDFYETNPNA